MAKLSDTTECIKKFTFKVIRVAHHLLAYLSLR
jgi:hypothetical protein